MVTGGEKPDSDLIHIEEKDHHLSNLIIYYPLPVMTLPEGVCVDSPYEAHQRLTHQLHQFEFIIDDQVAGSSSKYQNKGGKSRR
jgi:hypothetical protein